MGKLHQARASIAERQVSADTAERRDELRRNPCRGSNRRLPA